MCLCVCVSTRVCVSACVSVWVLQRVLAELEDISQRVDSVRDQAIILMSSRGPACRDVVEPKLAELNRNYDKVSQHIRAAKVRAHTHNLSLPLTHTHMRTRNL